MREDDDGSIHELMQMIDAIDSAVSDLKKRMSIVEQKLSEIDAKINSMRDPNAPTAKQLSFIENICKTLHIPVPEVKTKSEASAFIEEKKRFFYDAVAGAKRQ